MKNILVINYIDEIHNFINRIKGKNIILFNNNFNNININIYDIILCNSNELEEDLNISTNQHLILFSNKQNNVDVEYEQLLKQKATLSVLFNNNEILCITKEKSLIKFNNENDLILFIKELLSAEYFKTNIINDNKISINEKNLFFSLIKKNMFKFNSVGKYIFGSVAIRTKYGFITTIRGKNELNDYSEVYNVDFNTKEVFANKKASLNAPLLQNIFNLNKDVFIILHYHTINNEFKTYKYSTPGTIKDSIRNIDKSFNIEYHGCFELYNSNLELIK